MSVSNVIWVILGTCCQNVNTRDRPAAFWEFTLLPECHRSYLPWPCINLRWGRRRSFPLLINNSVNPMLFFLEYIRVNVSLVHFWYICSLLYQMSPKRQTHFTINEIKTDLQDTLDLKHRESHQLLDLFSLNKCNNFSICSSCTRTPLLFQPEIFKYDSIISEGWCRETMEHTDGAFHALAVFAVGL